MEDLFFEIGKTLSLVDPNIKLFVKQAMIPKLEGLVDWVTFDIIAYVQSAGPSQHEESHFMLQIIAYSMHAEYRPDHSPGAVYKLADTYKNVFNQKTLLITGKDWIAQFKEPRVSFMDNRLMGDFSKTIYQQSPEMKCMAGVILIEGVIVTN